MGPTPGWGFRDRGGNTRNSRCAANRMNPPSWDHNPPMRPTGPGVGELGPRPGPAKGEHPLPWAKAARSGPPAFGPHGRFVSGGSDILVLPGGVLVVLGAGLEAAVQDADEPVRELPQRGVVADLPGPERVVIGPRAG